MQAETIKICEYTRSTTNPTTQEYLAIAKQTPEPLFP